MPKSRHGTLETTLPASTTRRGKSPTQSRVRGVWEQATHGPRQGARTEEGRSSRDGQHGGLQRASCEQGTGAGQAEQVLPTEVRGHGMAPQWTWGKEQEEVTGQDTYQQTQR